MCLRYSANRQDAEDILQDGFLKIYRDMHQYKPEAPFGAWARKVMVNTSLEHIRKMNRRPKSNGQEIRPYDSVSRTDPSTEMNAKDLMHFVRELPEDYRLVFNLVAIEGYSHKEVEEMLKITVANSKVRLNRARKILQRKIESIYQTAK